MSRNFVLPWQNQGLLLNYFFDPSNSGYDYVYTEEDGRLHPNLRENFGPLAGLVALSGNNCGCQDGDVCNCNSNGNYGTFSSCGSGNNGLFGGYGTAGFLGGFSNGSCCNGNSWNNYSVNGAANNMYDGTGSNSVVGSGLFGSDGFTRTGFSFESNILSNPSPLNLGTATRLAGHLAIPKWRNIQLTGGVQFAHFVGIHFTKANPNCKIPLDLSVECTAGLQIIPHLGTIVNGRPQRVMINYGVTSADCKGCVGVAVVDEDGCNTYVVPESRQTLDCNGRAFGTFITFLKRGTTLYLVNLSKCALRFKSATDRQQATRFINIRALPN